MAYTPVGVGTVANDNTGDPIRTAFQTINANFVTLDGLVPDTATLTISGNDLVGTAANTDVVITPNGTGSIVLDGVSWPQADGTVDQILSTDGAGQLSYVTPTPVLVTATTAELAAIGNAINTSADKVQGYQVYNTTTDAPVWAAGNTPGALWNDATGALAHTPV